MPAGSSALKQKHPELLTNAIFRTEAREQAGVTCGKSRAEHRLALPRSTCQAIPPRPGQLPPKREPLAGRAVPRLGEGWEACCGGHTCLLSSLPLSPLLRALPDWGRPPACGPLSIRENSSTLLPHRAALTCPRTFTAKRRCFKQAAAPSPFSTRDKRHCGFRSVLGTLLFFLQSVHLNCHLLGPSHLPSDCPSSTRSPDP